MFLILKSLLNRSHAYMHRAILIFNIEGQGTTACIAYWLTEKILTGSCWQHSKIFRSLNNSPSCTEPGLGRILVVYFFSCLWVRTAHLVLLVSEKAIVALEMGRELGMLWSLTIIGSWNKAERHVWWHLIIQGTCAPHHHFLKAGGICL